MPGRMGKPIGRMRRFLKKAKLPSGMKYAILTREGAPRPDTKSGRMPTEEDQSKWQENFHFHAPLPDRTK
jgi:hypothetical protein